MRKQQFLVRHHSGYDGKHARVDRVPAQITEQRCDDVAVLGPVATQQDITVQRLIEVAIAE